MKQQFKRTSSDFSSQGFTLTELLVVIIIMALLAAMSLPALLGQAAKARESSAKTAMGLVNRAQARYRSEKNQFADSFDALAVGAGLGGNTTANTELYKYTLATTDIRSNATIMAEPNNTADRSFTGGTLFYTNTANQPVVMSRICESDEPNVGLPPLVQIGSLGLDCPTDYHQF